MKSTLLFSFCTFCCLAIIILPALLHAAPSLPRQAINISFDLEKGIMQGESIITLPPNQGMEIYLGDLADVHATLGSQDDDHTITLPPTDTEQVVTLSWKLASQGHGSGNLISKQGITLTGLWYPITGSDMLYSLTAVLPDGFDAITEADKLVTTNDQPRLLKAEYPHPIEAINFAAGPYIINSKKVGKINLYTYFFEEDASLSEEYLDKAASYITHYEKQIGPFPFKRYSIVENRLPTGYGMPTYTLLGQAVIRLPFIKDTSLGHEILHSWFGNAVRPDDSGNWCEGLTTYLADQWYGAVPGEGSSQYRKNQLSRYQSYIHKDNITSITDFQHGGDSQPMAKKMRAIGYEKSSMFFHLLRRELGDADFFASLSQLYLFNKYNKIGWTDIETIFSETSNRDLSAFFGQWLLRHDIPLLTVDQVSLKQKGGNSILSFHLQQQGRDPFQLKVPLLVKTRHSEKSIIADIDQLDQEVTVTLDSLPTELIIDPDYNLLRQLSEDEFGPAWVRFLGAGAGNSGDGASKARKTVVLPEADRLERYLPLVAAMERSGCRIVQAEELKNSELSTGSFMFLDSSIHTMGLFASPSHPQDGFTLDVRKNPLAPEHVMVLVTSSATEETARVMRKLNHYGKYSYLHFNRGRIKEKRTAVSDNGIRLPMLAHPAGIPTQKITDFAGIIKAIKEQQVIYVGETHTDYGSHLLQLQIIQALKKQGAELAIGMEMFPRASQQALDEYVKGVIEDEQTFLHQANYFKVWGYDYRLYRDIINYAKKHGIPIVGLNLKKEITSTLFRKGSSDSLSKEQMAQVSAERDLELPGYSDRLRTIYSMHAANPHGSGFGGFIQAQSFWDETMAESIALYLQKHPEKQMVVIAGTGHVYKDSGIPPRVGRRIKGINQAVLIPDNGEDRGIDEGKLADFLMFTESIELEPSGKIGVVLEEVKATGETKARLKIIRVSPHGKAGAAGLVAQDIILAMDNSAISTVADLKAGLMDKRAGEQVVLTIEREDKTIDITVELSNMSQTRMPPGHPKVKK